MKTIKWGMLMLAISVSVACNNNKNDGEGSEFDTTSAITDSTGMSATTTDNTGDMQPANTETSNMNAGNSASGTDMNGANTGSMGTANTAAAKTRKDTAGFAETGQYNSDVATPKPKNLDDKQYKKNPQAHSYGDTSPRSRPH